MYNKSMDKLKIEYIKASELKEHKDNVRIHNKKQIEFLQSSIQKYGFINPVVIDNDNNILAGHGRVKSIDSNIEVPCIRVNHLSDDDKINFMIDDNTSYELGAWDDTKLKELLKENKDSLLQKLKDFDTKQKEKSNKIDVINKVDTFVKSGEVWQLGNHRLLCGDCTIKSNVDLLMNDKKADCVFTDPPYGMDKNFQNDDLNNNDLIDFHKKWISLSFDLLKDNGSWYCWNNDIGILNIYSEILKPLIRDKKLTFRNIITWDKDNGNGMNSELGRMYAVVDEKCLFLMKGNQESSINAKDYDYKFEPIRLYLYNSRLAMRWSVEVMKTIVGHSDKSRDHWTSKSQWEFPSRKVYEKLQKEAEKQRKDNNINNDAFCKSYDDLLKEYESKKAYFNNTHDNFNNVWHFYRVDNKKKMLEYAGHDTPKPIELCERGIKTSSRENEIVCDLFAGSGSTLIACENTNRVCYAMEIDAYYCSVIIDRWQKYTNQKAIKIT